MENFKLISEHAGNKYLILLGINTVTGLYEVRYIDGNDMPLIHIGKSYTVAYYEAEYYSKR